MSAKRRDTKGRILRGGESQRKDGRYMYRYTDNYGERITIYSWKLVDKLYGRRKAHCLPITPQFVHQFYTKKTKRGCGTHNRICVKIFLAMHSWTTTPKRG